MTNTINTKRINQIITFLQTLKIRSKRFSEKIRTHNISVIEDFNQASKVSRDYVFDLNLSNNSLPLLNIYGGKLTTYRKLSEKVIDDLQVYLSLNKRNRWTSNEIL